MISQNIVRLAARRNPQLLLNRAFHYETYVSGPPRVRISLAEKAVHGLVIACAFAATPMWVLSHLKEYMGGPPAEEE